MANYVSNVRYASWEDYYLKKKRDPESHFYRLTTKRLSAFDSLPIDYVNRPDAFKNVVESYPEGNFIIIPAGGNLVRCIHHCFVFDEPGGTSHVIGISGSRRSSPFKSLNIESLVKPLLEPRARRNSEQDGGESWAPTMIEFFSCRNADEFKDIIAKEKEEPTTDLWTRAQSFWIHPSTFETLDANKPQRAGDIAMLVLKGAADRVTDLNEEMEDDEEVIPREPEKEAHQLILFLWAIENLRSSKAPLTDAPTSELFDRKAQAICDKLNPRQEGGKESRTRGRSLSPNPSRGKGKELDSMPSDGSSKSPDRNSNRNREKKQKGRRNRGRRGDSSPSTSSSDSNSSKSSKSSHSKARSKSARSRKSRSKSSSKSIRTRSRSESDSDPSRESSRSRSRSRSRTRTRTRSRSAPRRDRRRPRLARPPRRGDSSDDDDDLNKAMIRNLAAMTASQLKKDSRDEKKKSMLSRLSPEAAKLFDLLAARDWTDEHPKMSKSMKDLVSDRDSQRAIAIIKTQTKRWSGVVSEKGLLGFFANGFAAAEIQESPGGFTIFMFKPITAIHTKDKKARQQQVRSMFGSTELDEDAIKYYAENDFYLAETLEGLEEQIYTCIKCLEKFTERRGIATEGFEHGLRMLQDRKRIFHHLLGMDRLFLVKFAYLLDRVFQNFVDELGSFYSDTRPIHRARRSLRKYQVNAIKMR
jgi:hypothetical protein